MLLLIFIFFITLHFNIILPQRSSKKKSRIDEQIESSSSSCSLSTPTRLRKDIPSTSTLLRFTPSPTAHDSGSSIVPSCISCSDIVGSTTLNTDQLEANSNEFNVHSYDCCEHQANLTSICVSQNQLL